MSSASSRPAAPVRHEIDLTDGLIVLLHNAHNLHVVFEPLSSRSESRQILSPHRMPHFSAVGSNRSARCSREKPREGR